MNAVEIEEAISDLAEQPFDSDSFPYAFLEAFGNKATTIKRLKSGTTNTSIEKFKDRDDFQIIFCTSMVLDELNNESYGVGPYYEGNVIDLK